MIALASDCLTFRLNSGEYIPYSVDMLSVEFVGETGRWFDTEFVNEAAKAVFHYFKHDLGRHSVSVGEFAQALEKVLSGFQKQVVHVPDSSFGGGSMEYDLCGLAQESASGGELFFFPRLRAELRQQLNQSPRVLRFRGLRGCVKRLAGARHWSVKCQKLQSQVVAFLRECLEAESQMTDLALIVQ
jgi:hypothetical protein